MKKSWSCPLTSLSTYIPFIFLLSVYFLRLFSVIFVLQCHDTPFIVHVDSLALVIVEICVQVLAAVIKAGAAREHEILAEIRDAVFSFIRKMEARKVMDTMLVSRVRILYIRSLLARSPELQSIKV